MKILCFHIFNKDLLVDGIITVEEFEAKKKQIMYLQKDL